MTNKTLTPVNDHYLWFGAILLDSNNITWIVRHIGIKNGATTYFLSNGENQISLTRKGIKNFRVYVA